MSIPHIPRERSSAIVPRVVKARSALPGPVEGPRGPSPLFDGPQWSWKIHHFVARLETGGEVIVGFKDV